MDLTKYIRDVPDFPKEGIIFKDITPLLATPEAFQYTINQFCDYAKKNDIEAIVGIDARGFIFGGAVANQLGLKFVPVRKKGKLPWKTVSKKYDLEYGSAEIEIHSDALKENEKVLIIDDLLATGGTAKATCNLVEQLKADIKGIAFLIDLTFLKGAEKLAPYKTFSLIKY